MLESRRIRLDEMRAKLETRHAAILEAQSALDKVRADDAESSPDGSAMCQFDEAARSLPSLLETIQSDIAVERDQLDESRQRLADEQQAIQAAQTEFRELISQHTDRVRQAEADLARKCAEMRQQEEMLQRSTATWQQTRQKDEQALVALFDRLKEQAGESAETSSSVERLNPPGIVDRYDAA